MATLSIDVISDVICPWCFLGKRRLDKALAQVPDIKVDVAFRPFFLDASIPEAGIDRKTYMLNKFGPERLKTIQDPLIKAGQEDGIAYDFNAIKRTPNSLNAHRLSRWAHVAGQQRTVMEALFTAYWCWGQDVSDIEVLKTIAIVNGINGDDIAKLLATDEDKAEILQEAQQVQQAGVNGVPTFIFNRKYALVGAQPVAALVQAIQKFSAEAA